MAELDDTQLPDDEALEYMQHQQALAAIDAEKERQRQIKMRSFRFTGGMC